MAAIELIALGKTYSNGQVAVQQLDLQIADGELLVLVGPSGSGKSTVLRMIAGLETPTAGQILVAGQDVTTLPPQERDLAMVFQSYALYPHMTVQQNLAFPLRMRGAQRSAIDPRVRQVADGLGLAEVLARKPAQLSGGQRQRVALGRALVREPRAFLLDEPLSNLDPALRVQTRAQLVRLHRQLGATMVYVTHDQEEAMTLGDRIAVLRDGILQQVATPLELYHQPVNTFVASFIGSPAMNLFHGEVVVTAGGTQFRAPGITLELPHARPASPHVTCGIRPQDIELMPFHAPAAHVNGVVEIVESLGSELRVYVRSADPAHEHAIIVIAPPQAEVAVDQQIGLRLPGERVRLFDGRTGQRLAG
jgi:multiple sugar transport system ATP-binding protein